MQRILLLLWVITFGIACNEIGPEINPTGDINNDPNGGVVSILDQQRQVLIEEFTGVRCVNCPAGSQTIENLLNIHGDQLIAVSIHSGFFSPPLSESQYDFRTSDGDNLLSLVGEPLGFPTAVINRKQFAGEFDLQLGQSSWAGYIEDEKAFDPIVKIGMQSEFNSTDRILKVDISLFPEVTISEPDVRLSLMITETDIEDYQETPDGMQADYKHKHVLRDFLTSFDGNRITEPLLVEAEINKSFTYTLPENWLAINCRLIAVVSLGGTSKEVLQAHSIKLGE